VLEYTAMPIYEYACPKCGSQFEELVRSAKAEKDVKCPKCGHARVERRPSVFAARQGAPDLPPAPSCGQCGMDGGCPYAPE
jgi:putative FmdB family regulatory protein